MQKGQNQISDPSLFTATIIMNFKDYVLSSYSIPSSGIE